MPFSRQMRSNKTSTGGWAKRPVKTLPLSVRTWLGRPYVFRAELNPSQTACVRSRVISRAETQNLEWSSTPVSALALLPSASKKPCTTSSCQSSIGAARSHRFQVSRRRRRLIGSMTAARTRQR